MSIYSYQTYDAFYPEVMPYFPGMPELLIQNAVRNSCIEFCERSDWLFYTPQPQSIIAEQNVYDLNLDLPTDTVVARVQSAWVYEQELIPKAEEDLGRIYGLDWRKTPGSPCFYTQYVTHEILIVPIPSVSQVGGLECTLVIRPSVQSTTVDASLLNRWHEVIAAGARSRLYATPGQAYENARMAEAYGELYENGIMRAQIMRRLGLTRAVLRVRPPRFF